MARQTVHSVCFSARLAKGHLLRGGLKMSTGLSAATESGDLQSLAAVSQSGILNVSTAVFSVLHVTLARAENRIAGGMSKRTPI